MMLTNKKPHAGQSMGFQRDLGNSDTQILATPNRHCKREATLIAQLALAGHAVYKLADGGYLVSKWNLSYHADDFNDLAQFAQRLGVIGGPLQ